MYIYIKNCLLLICLCVYIVIAYIVIALSPVIASFKV